MKTYIGNDRCTRCGGGSSACPVCNPIETTTNMISNNFSDSGESVETPSVACVPAKPSHSSEGLDGEAAGGELFDIPVTKSPCLLWMERHHLTVSISTTPGQPMYCARHNNATIGRGDTKHEALVSAAKSLNIKLWNE